MTPLPRHRSPLSAFARAVLLASSVLIVGCASKDPSRTGLLEPYRIDLPQGNYLTQAMIDQIKPGMSREQVRVVLGSPLLNHVFHADRWDYVFRFRHPSGTTEQRKVTILFKEGRVTELLADALPQREDPADPALPGFKQPALKR